MELLNKLYLVYLKYSNPVKRARLLGVKVGENTMISSNVFFSSEPYLIEIGNNCQITSGVVINTHGGGILIRNYIENFDMFGRVIIEDNSYIGSNSIIMPGVTIRSNTLVAAGSVVTKSTDCNTIVGGNPARTICSLEDFINKNKKYNIGTFGMSYQKKKEILLNIDKDRLIHK